MTTAKPTLSISTGEITRTVKTDEAGREHSVFSGTLPSLREEHRDEIAARSKGVKVPLTLDC